MIVDVRESIEKLFPGDGLEIPSDDERNEADALIRSFALLWNEPVIAIPRIWVAYGDHYIPTNRAFVRSRLKRWFAKK